MRYTIGLLIASSWIASAGCGSGVAEGGQVTGLVTLDGQPVANAKVTFFKTGDNAGVSDSIVALTDAEGRYNLSGGDPSYRGTAPGSYKVTVYKLVPVKNAVLPEDADPEQIEASGLGKNTLPAKTARPHTTTLTATVQDGPNTFDIALKSK